MTTLSTKDFKFDRVSRRLTAEISSLGHGNKLNIWTQAYPDSCDEGVRVVSEHTGEEIMFVVEKIDYYGHGEDRELGGWHLVPTDESKRRVPKCRDLKMLIIND